MPIPILCPCSAKLRVSDHLKGLQIQCPKCLAIHDVAGAKPTNGVAAAPAPVQDPEEILAKSGFSAAERERLEDELKKGERLVWAGKPEARMALVVGLGPACGGFFLAVVLVVILVLVRSKGMADWQLYLLLGSFAAVGIVAGLASPFLNRFRYAHSAYALTTRRALVWDRALYVRPRFTAYGPEDVASVTCRQYSPKPDAIGHLTFAAEVTKIGQARFVRFHGFFYLRGARAIEKLLREHLIDAYTDRILE